MYVGTMKKALESYIKLLCAFTCMGLNLICFIFQKEELPNFKTPHAWILSYTFIYLLIIEDFFYGKYILVVYTNFFCKSSKDDNWSLIIFQNYCIIPLLLKLFLSFLYIHIHMYVHICIRYQNFIHQTREFHINGKISQYTRLMKLRSAHLNNNVLQELQTIMLKFLNK